MPPHTQNSAGSRSNTKSAIVERIVVMRNSLLMLHLLGLRLTDQIRQALDVKAEDPERGSVTIEQVAWAAAVIAIVAIAVAAIKAYVTSQVGRL
jgi:hypothetical protein